MFHYPHCPMIIIKYNVYIYNIYILLVVYSISKYHQVSILTTVYLHSIPIPSKCLVICSHTIVLIQPYVWVNYSEPIDQTPS